MSRRPIRRRVAAAAVLAGIFSAGAATARADDLVATLKVGDNAPALQTGEWLKGQPVARIEPGKVYALEFWSTSCAWCVPAMTHMSALAAEHPDFIFIGQDIFEDDDKTVRPFLQRIGEGRVSYRVALDDKKKVDDGAMATTWFTAAGYESMPAVIVVGRDSKIAWTGRPDDLDPVLDQIAAGTFDPKAAADAQAKAAVLDRDLAKAVKAGDPSAALKATQGLRAARPADAETLSAFDINLLYRNGRPDDARKQAATLANTGTQAKVLGTLAWNLATLDRPTPDDLKIARRACDRAMELGGRKDADPFDSSARLHGLAGEWDQAVADQQAGLERAVGDDNQSVMRTSLDAYKKHELPALK